MRHAVRVRGIAISPVAIISVAPPATAVGRAASLGKTIALIVEASSCGSASTIIVPPAAATTATAAITSARISAAVAGGSKRWVRVGRPCRQWTIPRPAPGSLDIYAERKVPTVAEVSSYG